MTVMRKCPTCQTAVATEPDKANRPVPLNDELASRAATLLIELGRDYQLHPEHREKLAAWHKEFVTANWDMVLPAERATQ